MAQPTKKPQKKGSTHLKKKTAAAKKNQGYFYETLKKYGFEIAALFSVIILGTVIYSNSFDCGFHFDDVYNIVENGAIRNLSDISAWWNYVPSRPVGTLTFALNFHFHHLDVWGYHLVNLIIHLFNAFMVYQLVKITFKTPGMATSPVASSGRIIALLAALLFVSHPLQTQSVTYIVQRLASLVTLFYLLSLYFYIRGRLTQVNKRKRIFFFGLSALGALLGMMTKENAFTIPVIILLYEFSFLKTASWKIRISDWRLWFVTGVGAAGAIIFLLNFDLRIFNDIPPEQGHTYYLTPLVYLMTQFRVLVTYLRLLILPVNQNLDYDYPVSTTLADPKTIVSLLILLAILVMAILLFRKYRMLSFGIFWFFITSAIESGFIPIVNVIFEHRTYLPGIGFFFFLSSLPFCFLRNRKKIAVIVLLLITGINSVLAYQRNFVWKTELSLWEDCARKSPGKARPLNNYGVALHDTGNAHEAIVYYNRAIEANPLYEIAWFNRGNAKGSLGKNEDAIKDYNEALRLKPDFYDALFKRGMTKKAMGDTTGAMDDLNLTLSKVPEFTLVYVERGKMKQEMGDTTGALADYSKAIELFSDFPEPYNKRGNLKRDMRDYNGALADYNKAIELFPENPDAYNNRGYTKAMMNDFHGAITDFNKAIELKDDFVEAYNNRANAKGMINDLNGAIQDFNKSIALNPQTHMAISNRGVSKLRLNDIDGACADFLLAAQLGNGQAAQLSLQYCR